MEALHLRLNPPYVFFPLTGSNLHPFPRISHGLNIKGFGEFCNSSSELSNLRVGLGGPGWSCVESPPLTL